jgi:hypothetical protein
LPSAGKVAGSGLTVNILRLMKGFWIREDAYAERARIMMETRNCEMRLQTIHLGKLDWRYMSTKEFRSFMMFWLTRRLDYVK